MARKQGVDKAGDCGLRVRQNRATIATKKVGKHGSDDYGPLGFLSYYYGKVLCHKKSHNSPMWRVVVGGGASHNSPHGRVVAFSMAFFVALEGLYYYYYF